MATFGRASKAIEAWRANTAVEAWRTSKAIGGLEFKNLSLGPSLAIEVCGANTATGLDGQLYKRP